MSERSVSTLNRLISRGRHIQNGSMMRDHCKILLIISNHHFPITPDHVHSKIELFEGYDLYQDLFTIMARSWHDRQQSCKLFLASISIVFVSMGVTVFLTQLFMTLHLVQVNPLILLITRAKNWNSVTNVPIEIHKKIKVSSHQPTLVTDYGSSFCWWQVKSPTSLSIWPVRSFWTNLIIWPWRKSDK